MNGPTEERSLVVWKCRECAVCGRFLESPRTVLICRLCVNSFHRFQMRDCTTLGVVAWAAARTRRFVLKNRVPRPR